MVLAVKGENPDNCTYSFLNMAALVDTYAAKTTGKDASTTVTIAGYEVDVKVNVSAAAGNALILKDDGLYVPTPEEVDISGKADKVTGATTGNFAALDGEGNLTDSGKFLSTPSARRATWLSSLSARRWREARISEIFMVYSFTIHRSRAAGWLPCVPFQSWRRSGTSL